MKLRLPQELKERIENAAADGKRSMNAEIVARLQSSFEQSTTGIAITPGLEAELQKRAADSGISYEEAIACTLIAGLHSDAPSVLYLSVEPGATVADVVNVLNTGKKGIEPDIPIYIERKTSKDGKP